MVGKIKWLEPWDSLCTKSDSFEKELYTEVGKQHILYGKKVTAIGRRYDCDDFLFQVHDSEFDFAVVHLTYSSNMEENPKLPRTIVFKDLNEWINESMLPVHSLHIVGEEE